MDVQLIDSSFHPTIARGPVDVTVNKPNVTTSLTVVNRWRSLQSDSRSVNFFILPLNPNPTYYYILYNIITIRAFGRCCCLFYQGTGQCFMISKNYSRFLVFSSNTRVLCAVDVLNISLLFSYHAF